MFNLKTFDRNEIQRRRFNILSKVNLIKRAEIIADYKLKKSRSCTSVISSNSEVKNIKKRSVINNQPIKRDSQIIFSRNNNHYYYNNSFSIKKLPILKSSKGKSLVNNIRYFDNGDTIDYIDKKCKLNMNRSVENFLNKEMKIKAYKIKRKKIAKIKKVLVGSYFEKEFDQSVEKKVL